MNKLMAPLLTSVTSGALYAVVRALAIRQLCALPAYSGLPLPGAVYT